MQDPFQVLGLPPDADDAAIRARYLELVKTFSPEHHPEKFAAVRAAYEHLRDQETRLRYRLFEAGRHESVEAIIEDLPCRKARPRVPFKTLLATVTRP